MIVIILLFSVVYEHRARLERSLQKEKTDHKNTKLGAYFVLNHKSSSVFKLFSVNRCGHCIRSLTRKKNKRINLN